MLTAFVLAQPDVTSANPSASASVPAAGSGETPGAAMPTVGPSGPPLHPGPVRVLGLGDSVTYGSNCDCRDYIAQLGTLLRQQDKVAATVDNEGEPGATTQDLADELTDDQSVRREVSRADIIVITIGANDLSDSINHWRSGSCAAACYQPSIDAMSDRLRALLDQIQALHTDGPAQVLVTNYWNVFTDGEVARRAEDAGYLAWSDDVTQAANSAICRAATSSASGCVDLYRAFKPAGADPTQLLSDDGDHPNAAGTALIASTVLATLHSTGPH